MRASSLRQRAEAFPAAGRRIVTAPWRIPHKLGVRSVQARVPSALAYYDRTLRKMGLQRTSWAGCCEIAVKQGTALLAVRASLNTGDRSKREPTLEIDVNHDLG